MHLSLLYRGPDQYVVLDGRREVGSLERGTLRFGPFETEPHAERAAMAGRAALRRWLESRPGTAHTDDRDATVAPSRLDAGLAERRVFAEFTLPPGTYAAVALHVAQQILAAIRESTPIARAEPALSPTSAA